LYSPKTKTSGMGLFWGKYKPMPEVFVLGGHVGAGGV